MKVRLQEGEFLSCAGETTRGKVRPTNQDRLAIWGPEVPISSQSEKGFLFAVADGMGGHQAGEQAAEIAIKTLLNFYKEPNLPESVEEAITSLIKLGNERILLESKQDSSKAGMGATLSGALTTDDTVFCFHLGDTRIYSIQNSDILQVTEDHVDPKGYLTNQLGSKNMTIQTTKLQTVILDYLIICSDGVWRPIPAPEIMEIVHDCQRPNQIVVRLLTLADSRGGIDNATAICIQFF